MPMPWQLRNAQRPKRATPRPLAECLPSININDLKIPKSLNTVITVPWISLRYPFVSAARLSARVVEFAHSGRMLAGGEASARTEPRTLTRRAATQSPRRRTCSCARTCSMQTRQRAGLRSFSERPCRMSISSVRSETAFRSLLFSSSGASSLTALTGQP